MMAHNDSPESDSIVNIDKVLFNILSNAYKGFNVIHFNARSLSGTKLDYVRHVFADGRADIICVTETWFNTDVPDSVFALDNFQIFRNDRYGKRGGGVAIYCRNGIKARLVSSSSDSNIEFLNIEILGNLKVLVSCVYNPHRQCSLEPFFNDLMTRISNFDFHIACGDFNINLISHDSMTTNLLTHVADSGLVVVNTEQPTRFCSGSTASLLDLFFVSDLSLLIKYDQMSFVSDHDLIFCSIDIAISSERFTSAYTYRDYNNVNIDALYKDLLCVPWSDCWACVTVDDKLNWFTSTISRLHDVHVPIKSAVKKPKSAPWFTSKILSMIKKRNILHSAWKRCPCDSRWRDFVRIRNYVNSLINHEKRKHYSALLNTELPTRQLWKNIRGLRVYAKGNTDCMLDPNVLLEHFRSVQVVRPTSCPIDTVLCSTDHSFDFTATSEIEVAQHISSISSNAIGYDGISLRFLKLILPCIVPTITHIFNHCLTTSVFPNMWKVATIIPVAKKSAAADPQDFRPISILPTLSKAFEKIIAAQITDYLNKNKLISAFQSGFRTKHSCSTAMLKILEDIRVPFDNNLVTMLCLLDFSKAFDTINHDLLCSKLKTFFNFGCESRKLIASYLSNRQQRVRVGTEYSWMTEVQTGVPQGSTLGPLLFVIYRVSFLT